MRNWAYECRKAMDDRDKFRAIIREIIAVMDNEERTPEEMLLLESASDAITN